MDDPKETDTPEAAYVRENEREVKEETRAEKLAV
jgi:hypothetical protein